MDDNQSLFREAERHIAGGVNSPVRAHRAVGGTPLFVDHAAGARLYDAGGREYIDYVQSWGPMIVGHAHPQVVDAVQRQAGRGLSYGTPCALETELARRLCEQVASLDLVRMVNSGTEATMSAIRLARAHTGRDRIVKFEGCYHGHSDALLVKAGSGALTLGVPSSPGVPAAVVNDTMTLRYNDAAMVEQTFAEAGDTIACVIVEPVAGNMNCVPPVDGFLQTLRAQCDRHGAVLIFDEVMTGFRLGAGGAQACYGVTPDLTTLGKVIGGGLPVGAFGGRREIMEQLAPLGPVYQAGTLSGNPIAMAAGIATLELVCAEGFYPPLFETTRRLVDGLQQLADDAGIALTTNRAGSMFGLFFTAEPHVTRYEQVIACDTERFRRFFHAMLERGVYLAPSAFEAGFVSAAHDTAIVDRTLEAARGAFAAL